MIFSFAVPFLPLIFSLVFIPDADGLFQPTISTGDAPLYGDESARTEPQAESVLQPRPIRQDERTAGSWRRCPIVTAPRSSATYGRR